MKKFILSILIAISPALMAQELSNTKLNYDDSFRPYVVTTVTNSDYTQQITSIEFEIEYTRNWGKMFDNITDPTYYSREKTIVRGNIPSRSSKTFTFYIPQLEDYKPYRITILRIRFANGNVKTINNR
ncbi:DUF2393 family protein [Phocaeicola barnesiae]|uniref:DUF2393 family protein n=1 Tax=Phocaeicola barnesiae TaxID=376804 RepID=UPI0025A3E42B|nr:DUF2393 family protein [Phocaeicola barnesiae]MDM8242463.1 DUF2393 family protein [Phocaeicola barnesiae]